MKKSYLIIQILFSVALLFIFIGCSSNDDETTPVNNPPSAPTGLAANQTVRGTVALTWTAGSSDADSFFVSRSADNSAWNQIQAIPATATTANDGTCGYNSQRWYKVKAKNTYGDSDFSSVVSLWTMPLVYSFGTDQTSHFTVSYDGSGTPFTWTYSDQAGKLHITNPTSGMYVHVLAADSLPNQGWFEANIKVGQWGTTEFAMFVERNPQDPSNDVLAAYFYRDSTVVGHFTSGSFVWKLQDTQHKMTENAWSQVRFLHVGNNWKVYLGTTELGSWDIANVASSGNLKMEWQVDIKGQTNQDFWLKDVAYPNPPVLLGGGDEPVADVPVSFAAPKTK